jgi:hypothetical protein
MATAGSHTLTATLLQSHQAPLQACVEHNFLRQAGQRTLARKALQEWLAQVRRVDVVGFEALQTAYRMPSTHRSATRAPWATSPAS